MITVNLFLTVMTVTLLLLCIITIRTPQQPTPTHQHSDLLFGDPFDIWRLVKVPEREAAQVIRRASRLQYKEIQHMYDQAGSVYILFQLCPPRRIESYGQME